MLFTFVKAQGNNSIFIENFLNCCIHLGLSIILIQLIISNAWIFVEHTARDEKLRLFVRLNKYVTRIDKLITSMNKINIH